MFEYYLIGIYIYYISQGIYLVILDISVGWLLFICLEILI